MCLFQHNQSHLCLENLASSRVDEDPPLREYLSELISPKSIAFPLMLLSHNLSHYLHTRMISTTNNPLTLMLHCLMKTLLLVLNHQNLARYLRCYLYKFNRWKMVFYLQQNSTTKICGFVLMSDYIKLSPLITIKELHGSKMCIISYNSFLISSRCIPLGTVSNWNRKCLTLIHSTDQYPQLILIQL